MRQELKGHSARVGQRRNKNEIRNSFTSIKKPKKINVLGNRFVCLAMYGQHKIPTTDSEKDELYQAGLGEKVFEFPSLDANYEEMKEFLYSVFPKLRSGGGFELCRCIPNSRRLEALSSVALSSPALLKERVGNSRTTTSG